MEEISPIKKRILQFIDYKGVSKTSFFEANDISYGNFKGKSLKSDLGSKYLAKISTNHPDLNITWLLTGDGDMLKNDISATSATKESQASKEKDKEIEELKKEIALLKDKYIQILEEQVKSREGKPDPHSESP